MMTGEPRRFFKLRFAIALLTYLLFIMAYLLLLVVFLFLGYHGLKEQNRDLLLAVVGVGLVIGVGLPRLWEVSKHILDFVKAVLKGKRFDD